MENKFKKRLTLLPVYFSLGDTSLGGGHVKGRALVAASAYDRPLPSTWPRSGSWAASSRQPLIISQFWTGPLHPVGASPKQLRKAKTH